MSAGATAAPLQIAVIGLSGSGKSTCARIICEWAAERGLTVARIPLARPLYELQRRVYAAAGVPLREGDQDQVLLEELATQLRRINPRSLVDDFLARAAGAVRDGADVLINDDLRDPHTDAPLLRAQGFRVVRVTCAEQARQKRLAQRGDISRADGSTSALDLIEPDAVLDNSTDGLTAYRTTISDLMGSWL
ncbi:ATP-binding protein [Sphaerimonospora mesophila]|uniref:ATP-binding protein n=1 Tax=Sphaerimonospora mesophila TaxID=37483 RepID=UPI0006E204F6